MMDAEQAGQSAAQDERYHADREADEYEHQNREVIFEHQDSVPHPGLERPSNQRPVIWFEGVHSVEVQAIPPPFPDPETCC
jgi:hypothetical protein